MACDSLNGYRITANRKKYAVILCLFMKEAYLCSHQKDKTYEKDSNDFGPAATTTRTEMPTLWQTTPRQ